jgi:hypothetical protein
MRFEAYKTEFNRLRAQYEHMEKAAQREWIAPELIVVDVRVSVYHDDVNPVIHVRKWHKDPAAACLVAGREILGGYFDFVHDPLSQLTPEQLERVVFAKFQVQRWIEGSLDTLPDQIWI